jgi:hypothetical protein
MTPEELIGGMRDVIDCWAHSPTDQKRILTNAIHEAIAAETERCARIAENYRDYAAYSQMPAAIAAAIRAKAG